MNWKTLIFGSIFSCIGVAFYVWGYQTAAPYLLGTAVQGQVVANLESKNRNGYFYRPMVEFTVGGAAKHRLIGDATDDEPRYAIGAAVNVLYVANDPENAVIVDFPLLFLKLFFVLMMGSLFLAFSVVLFRGIRSSGKTAHPEFPPKTDAAARAMNPSALAQSKEEILLKGVVDSVRQQHASSRKFVVICRAILPGTTRPKHFESKPISFHPGRQIRGKSVDIHINPGGKAGYKVMLEPVLAEHRSEKP